MAALPDTLPEAEIRRLADLYRFSLDTTSSAGTFGVQQGRETGPSVEIQDFREYVPGDDPRRVDWFSSARTGRLIVRLYREEVSPFFDVVVDASASMAISDGRKGPLAYDLCRWIFRSAMAGGVAVRLFSAGEQLVRLEAPDQIEFGAPDSVLFTAPRRAVGGLRRASARLVISDFMSPVGPSTVVRALAAGCSRLIVVHVLGPWEASPAPAGPSVLDAVEEGRRADLTLDRRAVDDYTRRLRALQAELRDETFRCGGIHLGVVADGSLEDLLRSAFVPAGLVEIY